MNKNERAKLYKALDHLENNPMQWEEAMALLYPLAGLEYRDLRKIKGEGIKFVGGVPVPNNQVQGQSEAALRTVPLERPVGRKEDWK